jgi:methionyl-tRNA formyltransferase
MKLQTGPVKALAERHAAPVFQPERLRDPASHEPIRSAVANGAEIMIVAAYGLILPQAVLDILPRGCLNIHASLLPRWRGAAPIQRAVEAGDAETGVTIMKMEAGLDTGPMLLSAATPIADDDTAGTVHDRLAVLGARLIVAALGRIDGLTPLPQPANGVTYAAKIARSEAALDWRRTAADIDRRVRAFNPFPGAVAEFQGTPIKVWRTWPTGGEGAPGTVLAADAQGIAVATGGGVLRLTELQRPGGKRLAAADFLRGCVISPGDRFALPAG